MVVASGAEDVDEIIKVLGEMGEKVTVGSLVASEEGTDRTLTHMKLHGKCKLSLLT
jgi:hypothetical protein